MDLDSLRLIDDFDLFKNFIRRFIITNEKIFRLIYFSNSNPFDEKYIMPEDPYRIFEESESNEHGVVLFKSKNSTILNSSTPILLVDFNSVKRTKEIDTIYIVIRIIIKDMKVNELENGISRSFALSRLIDDEFNLAYVNGLGETRRQSIDALSLNENNVGYSIIYKANAFNSDWSTNKNFRKRIFGDNNG